jgi:hypothetical protein
MVGSCSMKHANQELFMGFHLEMWFALLNLGLGHM